MIRPLVVCTAVSLFCWPLCLRAADATPHGTVGPGVPAFSVRPGYRVTLAASDLPEARFVEFDDHGTLYLSQPARGQIVALSDPDEHGLFQTQRTFISGQRTVHGMHFFDGWLWFTTSGAIYKARPTADGPATQIVTVIAPGQLPSGGGHWWRSILVTPTGFYTSIGDSGNVEDQSNTDRQKIWHFDLDGSNKRLFASGLRNTEKLRLRPGTDEVWGCDHGSDNWGKPLGESRSAGQPFTDLNPPDEFNHYVQDGFYGHPFIDGNRVPRYEYAKRPDIIKLGNKTIPPAWCNGAHWANNGWTFLTQDRFPTHRGDAIIAFHGSWNSSTPVGYCIQRILFDAVTGRPYGSQTVVNCLGGADGRDVLARPVDCAEAPDGTIIFSTDRPPRLFRISPDTPAR